VVALLLVALGGTACDSPFAPAATATATVTATATPSVTVTNTPTRTATSTATATATATATPTLTPSPTATPLVSVEECRYLKWVGTGLLKLALNGTALTRDEQALHNTTIFNAAWRKQTLDDLAHERDAADLIHQGYTLPIPPTLSDLDRETRNYAEQVYSASIRAYDALNTYDLLGFSSAYDSFGPLSSAGDKLANDLDAWARGRTYANFTIAATTCRP
jgi:hypothetical protein